MWFKQIQIWSIDFQHDAHPNTLIDQLQALAFKPCLPTLPSSLGWVSPIDDADEMPLVIGINHCLALCLQVEEKILPAQVISHMLKQKIQQIEKNEEKRVRKKEKECYKEEIIHTLMPRAFSKYSRIHAYIDTKNKWLVINTVSPKKADLFIGHLKKSLGDQLQALEVVKPSLVMTEWLKNQSNPSVFSIEKFCLLQDPNQQSRTIRCQQQNLFAASIQSLMQDGCDVVQLSIGWHDKLQFILTNDFHIKNIQRMEDDLIENKEEFETKLLKFSSDFFILSELLSGLINDLLSIFSKQFKITPNVSLEEKMVFEKSA